jgi:hypothetical protein
MSSLLPSWKGNQVTIKDYEGLPPCSPRHPKNKVWIAMQERWRHNGHMGSARMMVQNCRSILNSPTATDEAKAIAVRIENDAEMLGEALRTRKEQQ